MKRARHHTALRAERGFTLLELLVVIAIISLLIAVLLPSLAESRRIAKRAKCLANLRSIGQGWAAYLDDNGGHFPQYVNANINYGGKRGSIPPYMQAKPLNPYLGLELQPQGDAPVFECPADTGGGPIVGRHYDHYGTSYSPNEMLIGQMPFYVNDAEPCFDVLTRLGDELVGVTGSRIANASGVILFGDFGWVYEWNSNEPMVRFEWHHKERTHNIVFMDGHAAPTRIRKGLHVTPEYSVIPLADFASEATQCQQEVPVD